MTTRKSVFLTPETHKELRLWCIYKGAKIGEIVEIWIKAGMKADPVTQSQPVEME